MSWNYPDNAEKGKTIEIEKIDRGYMFQVKRGVALALNMRSTDSISYNIKTMKLGVFKGPGKGWIVYDLILKTI